MRIQRKAIVYERKIPEKTTQRKNCQKKKKQKKGKWFYIITKVSSALLRTANPGVFTFVGSLNPLPGNYGLVVLIFYRKTKPTGIHFSKKGFELIAN